MMRRGFSIIELMIAIGLASFIMLGMMQGYRNAIRLQRNAQNLLVLNRRIALLFNQIERDITTAAAYSKPVEYAKAEPKAGDKNAEPPKKEEQKQSSCHLHHKLNFSQDIFSYYKQHLFHLLTFATKDQQVI